MVHKSASDAGSFSEYVSNVATKLQTRKNMTGGGGGIGYSSVVEKSIGGQPAIQGYGKNMDPILMPNGSLQFPSCGDRPCGSMTGGGKKRKMSKRAKSSHHRKSAHRRKSTSHRRKSASRHKKSAARRTRMHGGGNIMRSQPQPLPISGEQSVLEFDPSLAHRTFDEYQPSWSPAAI